MDILGIKTKDIVLFSTQHTVYRIDPQVITLSVDNIMDIHNHIMYNFRAGKQSNIVFNITPIINLPYFLFFLVPKLVIEGVYVSIFVNSFYDIPEWHQNSTIVHSDFERFKRWRHDLPENKDLQLTASDIVILDFDYLKHSKLVLSIKAMTEANFLLEKKYFNNDTVVDKLGSNFIINESGESIVDKLQIN